MPGRHPLAGKLGDSENLRRRQGIDLNWERKYRSTRGHWRPLTSSGTLRELCDCNPRSIGYWPEEGSWASLPNPRRLNWLCSNGSLGKWVNFERVNNKTQRRKRIHSADTQLNLFHRTYFIDDRPVLYSTYFWHYILHISCSHLSHWEWFYVYMFRAPLLSNIFILYRQP